MSNHRVLVKLALLTALLVLASLLLGTEPWGPI
jgi:hypothetical protein